jgi:hypothetical protein|nr:MAG TPA: Very-short-patch-repair endonuclease [Caudoviricetes sp.]
MPDFTIKIKVIKMKKIDRFTKSEFESLCRDSTSYRDLASKLGYSKDSGSANAAIKRKIQEYGINPTWFTGAGWSRGLTKETDSRVARITKTLSEKYKTGEVIPAFSGHHHSDKTKQVMAEKAKYNALHQINGWKCGNSKIQNKYERQAAEFLSSVGIAFEAEKTLSKKKLGLDEYGIYNLDFLIDGILDLEIDGSSHNTLENILHDEKRDSVLIANGYSVYRIKTNDNQEILAEELRRFADMYFAKK